jgi:hypothetical protein
MTTKKTTKKQTLTFNKFFPDADAYVTLRGMFNPNAIESVFEDEFDLDLTIQNGTGRYINLFTWLGDNCTTVAQLKAINEATGKAIKFYEDSLAAKKEAKKSKPIDLESKRVTKQRK